MPGLPSVTFHRPPKTVTQWYSVQCILLPQSNQKPFPELVNVIKPNENQDFGLLLFFTARTAPTTDADVLPANDLP